MREGRTLTKPLTIEARQHRLLGIDLGEGVRRRILGLGTLGFVGWNIVMVPVLIGTGFFKVNPSVAILAILALPLILILVGFQPTESQPRRMNVTTVALRLRYLTLGFQPLIGLGMRDATRAERMRLLERLSPEHRSTSTSEHTQHVIHRHVTARLIGTDHLRGVIERGTKRARKGQA
ncbi:hypothetical protein C5C13_15035 [Clavibacter michiganensis]|jgi:hypothetical protein|nr:hypothetical protein C5C13_15035 [Clavibacter michiganensis]